MKIIDSTNSPLLQSIDSLDDWLWIRERSILEKILVFAFGRIVNGIFVSAIGRSYSRGNINSKQMHVLARAMSRMLHRP